MSIRKLLPPCPYLRKHQRVLTSQRDRLLDISLKSLAIACDCHCNPWKSLDQQKQRRNDILKAKCVCAPCAKLKEVQNSGASVYVC